MKRKISLLFLCIGLLGSPALAITQLPVPGEIFQVNGRNAFLMSAENPADGNPWVWYAPTLNNLPNALLKFFCQRLLEQGIAVAGYDLGEVRGSPESSLRFTDFYHAMVEKGYAKKPVLLGQSRGGLMMLCWGFRNPEKVQAIAGIYPVCNLLDWPLLRSKAATLNDYGISEDELVKRVDTFNPPANLTALARHQVPVFLVHGDSDLPVPCSNNSAMLEKAYKEVGGNITLKIISGQGHNGVPEFFQNEDLLTFLIEEARNQPE